MITKIELYEFTAMPGVNFPTIKVEGDMPPNELGDKVAEAYLQSKGNPDIGDMSLPVATGIGRALTTDPNKMDLDFYIRSDNGAVILHPIGSGLLEKMGNLVDKLKQMYPGVEIIDKPRYLGKI